MIYRCESMLILILITIVFVDVDSLRFDDTGDQRFLFSDDETRARLIMIDGNMYFHAGKRHNITFITNDGGSIYFGQLNIENLPALVNILDLHQIILCSLHRCFVCRVMLIN